MFHQLQSRSYGIGDRQKLYIAARGNLDFIQRLKLERRIEAHTGCVNTICWNDSGTCILSGSDDQHLMVTNPYTGKIIHKIRSGHRQNIFSAKFLPSCNDTQTVSCSGDGKIFYTNLDRDDTYGTFKFDCHFGTAYEVIVVPNEASTFLSCGEDGTVRFFDLRAKTSCNKKSCKDDVLISCRSALTAISTNPVLPWQLGIGCSDSSVRIYDRRMLGTRATGNYTGKGITGLMCSFTPPSLERESYRVTSLNFSPDGKDVLVSYSSEFIYLFGTDNKEECKQLIKESPVPQVKTETKEVSCDETVPPTPKPKPACSRPAPDTPEPTPGTSTANLDDDSSSRAPPVKRLRLRGDWSDTGPRARPESERQPTTTETSNENEGGATGPGGSRAAIMNRMSDLLTRWLYGNMRQGSDQSQQEGEALPNSGDTEQNQSEANDTEAVLQSAENSQTQSAENLQNQSADSQTVSEENTQNVRESQAQSENFGQKQTTERVDNPRSETYPRSETSETEQEVISENSSLRHSEADSDTRTGSPAAKGHTLQNEQNETYLSLKSEQDSSDSKSDESQSSFVHKIEAMNVDDSDQGLPGENITEIGKLQTRNDIKTEVCMEADSELNDEAGAVESENREDFEFYNPLEPTSYPLPLAKSKEKDEEMKDESVETKQDVIPKFFPLSQKNETESSQTEHKFLNISENKEQSSQSETDDLNESTVQNEMPTNYSSGQSDEEPPYMVETGVYRETVSAAVSTLRSQNVKPVVSLHYSSEGTSASTIKVGFTQFQSLEEEIEEQNPQIVAERSDVDVVNGSNTDHVSNSNGDPARNHNDINVEKSADIKVDNDNFSYKCFDVSKNETDHGSKIDTSSLVETESKSDPTVLIISQLGETGNSGSENEQGACAMDIGDCDNESAFKPFSVQTADNEQCLVIDEDFKQRKETENTDEAISMSLEVPSGKLHFDGLTEDREASRSEDTASVDESTNGKTEGIEVKGGEPGCSKQAETVITASAESMDIVDEADRISEHGTVSQRNPISASETASERPRRRRIGHSGPPTGDFQLYGDSGGSSSDEEQPEQSTASTSRGDSLRDFERTTAALKLQTLHRLRQEAKEKKEMEATNVFMPKVKNVFKGHRNARTMIKESNFWGDRFVLSGSDCGHVFIWDRYTTKVVMLLEADKHVVNCIQPHPFDTLLATSGIDYDVKIWAPLLQQSGFDEERAREVIHRNEIMLEETRDTITVPAAFMLRVLASINSIRAGRRAAERDREENAEDAQEEHESDTE